MASCSGIRADGGRCRGIAGSGSDWCPAHDPARREARKRAASKAARSKVRANGGGIDGLKRQAREVFEEVRRGEVDPKVGGVLVQALNAQARILELEAKLMVLAREWMTPEEAENLTAVLREAVERHVPDPVVRDAIGRHIAAAYAE